MINFILKVKYIQVTILAFLYGLEASSFIKLYGSLDIDIVAILNMFTTGIGVTAVIMNRVNEKITFTLPYYALYGKLIIYILLYCFISIEQMIMALVILETAFSIIWNHRCDAVTEKTKSLYNIKLYSNNSRTLKAIGGIFGSTLALFIVNYVEPFYIMLNTIITETVVLTILMLLIDSKLNLKKL